MPIITRAAELSREVTDWRRDFHAHPELLYDVQRTAALVAERLRSFGCDEVVTGVGRTGVVGVIRGSRGHGRHVVGLRADMDALPIAEATGLAYASTSPGLMHACGHDGHTALLLGAAKYLAETRRFDGTAVMIFQPAEEGGGGGDEMVKDGLMERFGIEEVYGLHNTPGLPVGRFAIRPGPIMAAGDRFELTISGKGGHAAHPERCVDTLLAATQIVGALQSIVARNVDPLSAAVLSVTSIRAGQGFNVLPQTAQVLGTVRTFDAALQDSIEGRLRAVAEATASAYGATVTTEYDRRVPATVNHPRQTEILARAASKVSSVDLDALPHMGGEDFAYMLRARPGAYIFMGNGASEDLHHPGYDFNDEAIPFGISLWARLIEDRMPGPSVLPPAHRGG